MAILSSVSVLAWRCSDCEWVWIPRGKTKPRQCPNRECRARLGELITKEARATLTKVIPSEAANGSGQTDGIIKSPHLQRVRRGVRNEPGIEGRTGDTGPGAIQRSPDDSPTNTGTVDGSVPEVQATRWLGPKHSATCKCKQCAAA